MAKSRIRAAQFTVEKHIGERLKLYRQQMGLSKAELDALCKEIPGTIKRLEQGRVPLHPSRLLIICSILNIRVNTLFKGLKVNPGKHKALMPDGISKSEITNFLEAYYQIGDRETRKKITDLCKSIAEDETLVETLSEIDV